MRFILACLIISVAVGSARAQATLENPHNYVVVIGAFAVKDHAEHFITKAKQLKLEPKIELNRVRNLYYVFVTETDDREVAIQAANSLRTDGHFKDAWVFFDGVAHENKPAEDIHPVTQEPIVPVVVQPEPPPVVKVDSAKLKEDRIREQVAKKDLDIKKGEMERLDNLYFFKDAAVLRPESKYEVDRLVTIMKNSPKMHIRIHGHTNGNASGKIIKRNNETSDFFSLDNTVEDFGSAKDLSYLRASLIKEYLISQGIDKNRMDIKAWGGKKPLFSVDSDKAEANVRVEIEVLK